MVAKKWKTGITKVEPNHLVTRGYRQEDLIGNVPYSHVVFLMLKGKLPAPNEGKMMDAILTSSIDHGVTPPSCLAARAVCSAGVPLQTAVAAGVLAIGDVHGGAIEGCAKFLQEGVKRMLAERKNLEELASTLVEETKSKKARIPGFGHRVHTADPRTKRLYGLAEELGIAKDHVALSKAIEKALSTDKKLPINVDGAIAAVISDMGFDYRLGKAFFLLGRVSGLTAHVYEEMTREKPMRQICTIDSDYDGPWERDLESQS